MYCVVLNDDRGVEISNLSANPSGIIPLWARAAYVTIIYIETLKHQNVKILIGVFYRIQDICERSAPHI